MKTLARWVAFLLVGVPVIILLAVLMFPFALVSDDIWE